MSLTKSGLVRFEEYEIDRARWQLTWRDELIQLNRKTFDLLLYLVEHRERVVGKEELLQALWPEQFIEESNLTQHVFLLRKALSRHESGLKIIQTVPGRGYRFSAEVMEAEPVSDWMAVHASESITRITIEEEQEETEVQPYKNDGRSQKAAGGSRRLLVAAVSVVIVIALLGAGWLGWQRWLDHTGGAAVQVVLTAMDGTTGDAVLDQTLVDALRIDLSQSPFVSVISSASLRSVLTQMTHKPDDPVTPEIAREVCERTNSQAVLRGTIARTGQHFLITEEATSCLDGVIVAASKQEAVTAEELPRSIDKLAEVLRRKLGESRRSIARFNVPLSPEHTVSLEALKEYSQALHLAQRGKMPDAIALAKEAVNLDPKFAAAWLQLSVISGNAGDYAGQREYIKKAYELRGLVNQSTLFNIIAIYNQAVTGDLYEALANFQAWATLYPRSSVPWSGLLQTNRELGRHGDAVIAGKHALELNPRSVTPYYGLGLEQLHAGDPRAARATCELALSRGLDGDTLHGVLFRVAVAVSDRALRGRQVEWAEAHPDATYMLSSEASLAMAEGRFGDAKKLLNRASDAYRRQGLTDQADAMWRQSAPVWADLGEVAVARLALQHGTLDVDEPFEFFALAAVGDSARAESLMRAEVEKHPQATLTNHLLAPWLRAQTALQEHRPADAVGELNRIAPLDEVFIETRFDRGLALLQSHQLPESVAVFRDVIARPYADVLSESIPLSWLNLGRAFAAAGNRAAAAEAYQHFFTLWSSADPDGALLNQAKREFAQLGTMNSHALPENTNAH